MTQTNITPFQTLTVANYTVQHVGGDCGPFITGNTFDEFGLFLNDQHIATLKVTYDGDGNEIACQLIKHVPELVVPIVAGDFHLIAAMMSTVMHHFTSEHEFYCDAFSDEDGNALSHALLIPV